MTRIMRIDSKLPENWYTANEKSYTVISNLTMNEEELLNLMRKKVKYEVTRAEKDELTYEIYDSEQLANDQTIIEEFEKAYIHFAKELEDKNVIKAYKRNLKIIYSIIIFFTRYISPIVFLKSLFFEVSHIIIM